MKNNIKLFITDIDGVWTDSSLYYDKTGNETRKFNLSDSTGILFLYLLNIPIIVITEENNDILKRRLEKLKVNEFHLGVTNKLALAQELIKKYKVTWDQVAFIGDDINDLKLLKKVGYAAAPAQAPHYIKRVVDYVMVKKGGEGAFREFVEKYLDVNGKLDSTIEKYLAINESF